MDDIPPKHSHLSLGYNQELRKHRHPGLNQTGVGGDSWVETSILMASQDQSVPGGIESSPLSVTMVGWARKVHQLVAGSRLASPPVHQL